MDPRIPAARQAPANALELYCLGDRGTVARSGPSVERGEFAAGGFEADLESLDLAEPAVDADPSVRSPRLQMIS